MSAFRSKTECLLLPEMCFSDQILIPESTLWLLEITTVRKKSARLPSPRMFLVTLCWDRCTRSAWEKTNKGKQPSQTVLIFLWIYFSLSNTRLSHHPLIRSQFFQGGMGAGKKRLEDLSFLFPELLIEVL